MGEVRLTRGRPVKKNVVQKPLAERHITREINANIRKFQFSKTAKDLIRIYNLKGSSAGKSFLRHELQRGLLRSIKKRDFEQDRVLSLLNAATTIEYVLWQSEYSGISLREALAVHEAALSIANTAVKKCGKRWTGRWKKAIQNLNKGTRKIRIKLVNEPDEKIKLDLARLRLIAQQVDNLMNTIMPQKSHFVGRGLEEINVIVKRAFKRERQ